MVVVRSRLLLSSRTPIDGLQSTHLVVSGLCWTNAKVGGQKIEQRREMKDSREGGSRLSEQQVTDNEQQNQHQGCNEE